ncbi:MAG: C_GCAxxG_C_C family protein [Lachnospiraceae bacterium]|nr:C_GCAxxG_C_C family protein [Lachnospiraceae bacterium]
MSDVTKYFYKGGLNCAETTLKCLIEDGVVDLPAECVKMMTGFGGGMQRGSICGAVTGAVAAIGSKYGRTELGEDRKPSADAVRTFLKQFEAEFGTIYCKELQKTYFKDHDRKSPEMYRACTIFVEKAVEWAKKIIEEN